MFRFEILRFLKNKIINIAESEILRKNVSRN